MKQLLLTSRQSFLLESNAFDLVGFDIEKDVLVYVPTAGNQLSGEAREYILQGQQALRDAGIAFEELDIEGMSEVEIRKALKDRRFIFVTGGDPFYLLKQVRASGFDTVMQDLVPKGELVYTGGSAGAYIACPTVRMALKSDSRWDASMLSGDFEAMNLVSFHMLVHHSERRYERHKEILKDLKKDLSIDPKLVYILTDEQALLIQDDQVTLLGDLDPISIR